MNAKPESELQEKPASLQSPGAAFQAHGEEADCTAGLRSFYANIPGMIYRGRPDWSTQIVQHSEVVCGHSVDAFRAGTVNWLDLIHPDNRQRVMEEGAALRETPCSVVQEYRILARDGSVRWVRDHKTSVFDDTGSFVGIDGIVYDITEHKRADEALRQSEQKLASLLDALTDHMSVMDEDYTVVWANHVAKRLFGPELVGRKCYEAYHGRASPCEPGVVNAVFEDGDVHEHETEVVGADGRKMCFWCTANVAERHEDGRPKHVFEISCDITGWIGRRG